MIIDDKLQMSKFNTIPWPVKMNSMALSNCQKPRKFFIHIQYKTASKNHYFTNLLG